MNDTRINILATREVPDKLAQKVTQSGIELLQKNFIEVSLKYNPESFGYYLNNPDSQARVFTSKNAVYSLQRLLSSKPRPIARKKNFTVGIRASEMLAEMGIESNARADNAISLAQIIARNTDVKAVDFFCGNKSLDDLPEYLKSKRIKVHQEIVYRTTLVQEKIDTSALNGVLFLSPSAVYSFFKINSLSAKVPLICIGATTAEAARTRCNNPRILANEPTLESTIDKLIETFAHEYHKK